MRPNLGNTKKQDFVKCLKINNLQSRRPKADPGEFEGVRPLNQYSAKGTKKASSQAMLFCVPRAGTLSCLQKKLIVN